MLGTPNAVNLLNILQSMVLLERGTSKADVVWPLLEELTQAAVLLEDGKQADNFRKNSMSKIKEAIQNFKENENSRTAGESSGLFFCIRILTLCK